MREVLRTKKYVGLILAAGIGGSALTGCGNEAPQTWEVGVTCPDGNKVQVGSLDTDLYAYGYDARVSVVCSDELGTDAGVTGMELTKGEGAIINTNKTYTNMIEVKYKDPIDGYGPEVNMNALTGYITTNNVEIQSVAVTD